MDEKKYSVLHEIGDYYNTKELNDKDNKIVNEQLNKQDKDNNKKDNK